MYIYIHVYGYIYAYIAYLWIEHLCEEIFPRSSSSSSLGESLYFGERSLPRDSCVTSKSLLRIFRDLFLREKKKNEREKEEQKTMMTAHQEKKAR